MAIGASAGGLEACTSLLAALVDGHGMAFILVQHLDPTHESMMVDLLAGYTSMVVRQATDGMPIERDHLYIIPPGTYLAVAGGALQSRNPWRVMVRDCPSISCCTPWPPTAGRSPPA